MDSFAQRGSVVRRGGPSGAEGVCGAPRGSVGRRGGRWGTEGVCGVPRGAKGVRGALTGSVGRRGGPWGAEGVPRAPRSWPSRVRDTQFLLFAYFHEVGKISKFLHSFMKLAKFHNFCIVS